MTATADSLGAVTVRLSAAEARALRVQMELAMQAWPYERVLEGDTLYGRLHRALVALLGPLAC